MQRLEEIIIPKLEENTSANCYWFDGEWHTRRELLDLVHVIGGDNRADLLIGDVNGLPVVLRIKSDDAICLAVIIFGAVNAIKLIRDENGRIGLPESFNFNRVSQRNMIQEDLPGLGCGRA